MQAKNAVGLRRTATWIRGTLRYAPVRWQCTCSALAVAVMLPTCRAPTEPPKRQPLRSVTFAFDWRRDRLGDSGFVTDRGYHVRIVDGALRTARIGLAGCPAPTAGWVAMAYADHAEAPDPAAVMPHLAESLTATAAISLPAKAVPPVAYCQLHWLVAAPSPAEAGDGPRWSLRAHLLWHKGGHAGQLMLDTWLPAGVLRPLPELQAVGPHATVTVVRDLPAALDGVELADAATPALAARVATRLVEDAGVVVTR